jgi:hypothetical protein
MGFPKTTRVVAGLVGVKTSMLKFEMKANPVHSFEGFEVCSIYNYQLPASSASHNALSGYRVVW